MQALRVSCELLCRRRIYGRCCTCIALRLLRSDVPLPRPQPEPQNIRAPLTRLVATLGPNSSSVEALSGLLRAGMEVRHSSMLFAIVHCASIPRQILSWYPSFQCAS